MRLRVKGVYLIEFSDIFRFVIEFDVLSLVN